ncbi:MAG: hypothetical protein HY211_08725 [Candidatus Omnitrophica bacterium]|nr:hypothetical protein [Candidatus Omnitrophota bacterium]
MRNIEGTAVAAMTYQKTPTRVGDSSRVVRGRAKEGNFPYLIGVETLPEGEASTPSFAGQIGQIGPVLVNVYDSMPKEDQTRMAGVFIHTRSPISAYQILQELEGAKVGQVPLSATVKSAQIKGTELTLALDGVPDGTVASLWIEDKKGDPGAWYRQPGADTIWRVRNGTVTVANPHTDTRKTFNAGRVRVLIVRDETALEAFLKQLNPRDPTYFNEATIRSLIRNQPFVEETGLSMIEMIGPDHAKILSPTQSGLEEGGVQIPTVDELDAVDDIQAHRLANAARRDGSSHVVLILSEWIRKAAVDEKRVVTILAQKEVTEKAVAVFPMEWAVRLLREPIPPDPEQMKDFLIKNIPDAASPVIALDSVFEGQMGEILPADHPVTLLINPYWEHLTDYAKALTLLLSQPKEVLQNLVLKLTYGSVRRVTIRGQNYVAIFA